MSDDVGQLLQELLLQRTDVIQLLARQAQLGAIVVCAGPVDIEEAGSDRQPLLSSNDSGIENRLQIVVLPLSCLGEELLHFIHGTRCAPRLIINDTQCSAAFDGGILHLVEAVDDTASAHFNVADGELHLVPLLEADDSQRRELQVVLQQLEQIGLQDMTCNDEDSAVLLRTVVEVLFAERLADDGFEGNASVFEQRLDILCPNDVTGRGESLEDQLRRLVEHQSKEYRIEFLGIELRGELAHVAEIETEGTRGIGIDGRGRENVGFLTRLLAAEIVGRVEPMKDFGGLLDDDWLGGDDLCGSLQALGGDGEVRLSE